MRRFPDSGPAPLLCRRGSESRPPHGAACPPRGAELLFAGQPVRPAGRISHIEGQSARPVLWALIPRGRPLAPRNERLAPRGRQRAGRIPKAAEEIYRLRLILTLLYVSRIVEIIP